MKKPKKPTKKPADSKTYNAKYREANPLLTTHVPKPVYEEVKRRSNEDRRSMSKWLALFLEKALLTVKIEGKRYPVAKEAIEDD